MDNTMYPQIMDVEQRIDYCIAKYCFPKYVKPVWMDGWSQNGPMKRDLLNRIIRKFSLNVAEKDLVTAYRACKTNLLLHREASEFLLIVRKKGIKQFVITNGIPKVQMIKANSLHLDGLVDEIVVATEAFAKPCDYWFRALLRKYRLCAGECLSVGDWYAVDGVASSAAGIFFVYMDGGPVVEDLPSWVPRVSRLSELSRYLKTSEVRS